MFVELTLQGGINFRDIGGYQTVDGRAVKRGLLFRSGAMSELMPLDIEALAALPLTHVLDYRDETEAQQKPDMLWPQVHYQCVPANPGHWDGGASLAQLLSQATDGAEAFEFMCELYRRLPFGNPAYRQLMAWLQLSQTQQQPWRIVQHCAIGKDRTGVGCAIALLALGVSREIVRIDYLQTEKTLASYRARFMTTLNPERMGEKYDVLSCMFSAQEAFIDAALNAMEKHYGDIAAYLQEEFGLDEDARKALQRCYLE